MADYASLMDIAESDPAPAFAEPETAAALEPFDDDVPPVGTACAGCRGLGHWCAAKCYRGDDTPLCRACAEGVDCSVVQTRLRRVAEVDWMPAMERESCAAGAVRDVTPLEADKRVVQDREPEIRRNYAGLALQCEGSFGPKLAARHEEDAAQRRKLLAASPLPAVRAPRELEVDVEVEEEKMKLKAAKDLTAADREMIRAASASTLDSELAIRIGTTSGVIWYQRKKLRDRAAKLTKRSAVALQRSEHAGVPIDMEDVGPRFVALGLPLAPTIEGQVSITVQEQRLDGWFAKLPAQKKAEIFFAEIGV